MWWELVLAAVGLLWWLGRDEEAARLTEEQNYTRKERRDRATRLNATKTALNNLMQSEEYQEWRRSKVEKVEKEVVVRNDAMWDMQWKVVLTAAVASWYAVSIFSVTAEQSAWGSLIAKLLLMQVAVCCDTPFQAAISIAVVTSHIVLNTWSFGTGYYLWVLCLYCKVHFMSVAPALQPFAPRQELEAYENVDYDTITSETYY